MPVVTFQPSGKSVSVDPGTELLDAAKLANIEIATPCGGKGTCGKCLVRILSGEVESNSTEILSETEEKNAHVQACRTKVLDIPVTAGIPGKLKLKKVYQRMVLLMPALFVRSYSQSLPNWLHWHLNYMSKCLNQNLKMDFPMLTGLPEAFSRNAAKKNLFILSQ